MKATHYQELNTFQRVPRNVQKKATDTIAKKERREGRRGTEKLPVEKPWDFTKFKNLNATSSLWKE